MPYTNMTIPSPPAGFIIPVTDAKTEQNTGKAALNTAQIVANTQDILDKVTTIVGLLTKIEAALGAPVKVAGGETFLKRQEMPPL